MSTYWKDRLFVGTQFLLMAAYIIHVDLGYFNPLKLIGLGMTVCGGMVGLMAIWQLRHSISPFPSPKLSAVLIDNGIFKWVRHPIYTGIMAMSFGYALVTGLFWKALIAVLLLILFQFKARYEEQLLQTRFEDYPSYMSKTGRFLPKLRL